MAAGDKLVNLTDLKAAYDNSVAKSAPMEASTTASATHKKGSYFVLGGVLYRALVKIASGETIVTSGSSANCEAVPGGLGGEVTDMAEALHDITDITGIKQNIAGRFVFTNEGYIVSNDGSKYPTSPSFSTSDYTDVSGFDQILMTMCVDTNATTQRGCAFYSAKNVSSYISGVRDTRGQSAQGVETRLIDVPSGAKYLRTTWYATGGQYEQLGTFSCYGIIKSNLPYVYKVHNVKFEPGIIGTNGACGNSQTAARHRSQMLYKTSSGARIEVEFSSADAANIASAAMATFSAAGAYVSTVSGSKVGNTVIYTMPSGAVYGKFEITHTTAKYEMQTAVITCDQDIRESYNLYIQNANDGQYDVPYGTIACNYVVSGHVMSSLRLQLPHNYSPDGDPVPLIVYVPGSGHMTKWDSVMGYKGSDSIDHRPHNAYLANEGFAVCSCYAWTDIGDSRPNAYTPYCIPAHKRAYTECVRYICSRYNVDASQIVMLCKSQGGGIAHWGMFQKDIPVKAIALFAAGIIVCNDLGSGVLFHNSYARTALLNHVPFVGTSEEKEAFASTMYGLTSDTVMGFMAKNKALICGMTPLAQGLTGATMDEIYDDTMEAASDVPEWMADLGLPEFQTGAMEIPKIAENQDLVKSTTVPSKFWMAFDDPNVSAYGEYAVYTWLVNGGSDTEWRTMPLDTGKHSAMDGGEGCLTDDGTTALGDAYTDIPVGYIEAVAFFNQKLNRSL